MCNAYNLKATQAAIAEAVERSLGLALVFPPGVTAATSNLPVPQAVFPRRDGLILRPVHPDRPRDGLEPLVAHWNLTPFFHRGPLKAWKASSNNCRWETMDVSPAFRDAFRRRRCLIPATSITEWTGPKGSKTAHAIGRADGQPMFLAGLWDRCRIEEAEVESYTMVMMDTAPGQDMHPFHSRQPVFLDAARAGIWLDLTATARDAIAAPPPGPLLADPPTPAAA